MKLEETIEMSKIRGKLICIETDANSKVCKNIIDGDPHDMSLNGKLLNILIERQGLILAFGIQAYIYNIGLEDIKAGTCTEGDLTVT